MEPTKTPADLSATHFFCERCGGMGQQEAGLWNPDTKRYDDAAGTCRSCHGSGYLGPLPPRTRLISQSELEDVLTHEGIIDYDAVERPEDYDGGTTELHVSIAARKLDRIARDNAKGEAAKLAEALEKLFEEYDDRKAQWGSEYLWEKHEDVKAVEIARAALAEYKQGPPRSGGPQAKSAAMMGESVQK